MVSRYRLLAAFAAVLAIVMAMPSEAAARGRQAAAAPSGSGYERRDDVREFIHELVRDDHFQRSTRVRWSRPDAGMTGTPR